MVPGFFQQRLIPTLTWKNVMKITIVYDSKLMRYPRLLKQHQWVRKLMSAAFFWPLKVISSYFIKKQYLSGGNCDFEE
jgi:hypothetical protein